MERLTEKAFKPSVNSQYVKKKGFYTADCIERLGVYEDIGLTPPEITGKMEALRIYKEQGLTPDQIAELKERDTAKAPIDADEDYGFFTCPSCGEAIYASDNFESHKFCLNCGQRIKWEE